MTITLEAIKAEQDKVAEMIAAFEAQAKFESAFPVTVQAPAPNPVRHLRLTRSAPAIRDRTAPAGIRMSTQ